MAAHFDMSYDSDNAVEVFVISNSDEEPEVKEEATGSNVKGQMEATHSEQPIEQQPAENTSAAPSRTKAHKRVRSEPDEESSDDDQCERLESQRIGAVSTKGHPPMEVQPIDRMPVPKAGKAASSPKARKRVRRQRDHEQSDDDLCDLATFDTDFFKTAPPDLGLSQEDATFRDDARGKDQQAYPAFPPFMQALKGPSAGVSNTLVSSDPHKSDTDESEDFLGLDSDAEDLFDDPLAHLDPQRCVAASTSDQPAQNPSPTCGSFDEARADLVSRQALEPSNRVGDVKRNGGRMQKPMPRLEARQSMASGNQGMSKEGTHATSGKRSLTKENTPLDEAAVSSSHAPKVATSSPTQDGDRSGYKYRWSPKPCMLMLRVLDDLGYDYGETVKALFRENTVSAVELRHKLKELVHGKVKAGSDGVSVITLDVLRQAAKQANRNPRWSLSEATQTIALMHAQLATSPNISMYAMAEHLSSKVTEHRVRGDVDTTRKSIWNQLKEWVSKSKVSDFTKLTGQGLRGHLPEDISDLFLPEIQRRLAKSQLDSVSVTSRHPRWTKAEERALKDLSELLVIDHSMTFDEAAKELRRISGTPFLRTARSMEAKMQSLFGGRYGMERSEDHEAWSKANKLRRAAAWDGQSEEWKKKQVDTLRKARDDWWNGLSEEERTTQKDKLRKGRDDWWKGLSGEEKESRIKKMHDGRQVWWNDWWHGLSAEDKERRIQKLHDGWQVWWKGLSADDYEAWRLSTLQATNQPMRVSTRMIDGEERTVATVGWEMRTISWRGMAAEQVFQRTGVALEDIIRFQDDWYLVWGTLEELKEAARKPVPDEFKAMRTRLEKYVYQGLECYHRLDHTGFPKTPDFELVLQAHLALLGLEDKQQYQSLVLDACAGTGASLDYNRSLTAATDHETKCPFQALREKGALRRMMAKGLGTVKRTRAPYVIEMWSLRTLCICVVNLRRDPRLPASAEPVPVLSVVSLLVDGDDVERAEDEHTSYWHRVIRQLEKSTARTKDPDECEPVIVQPIFDFLLDAPDGTAPAGDVVLTGADGEGVRIRPTALRYSSPLEHLRGPINGTRPPLHHVPGLVERCPTKYDRSIEKRAQYLDPRTMYAVLQ